MQVSGQLPMLSTLDHHHHHHHDLANMELGHLLTHSGLTCLEDPWS
jgi:cephalosporin hydroxylase